MVLRRLTFILSVLLLSVLVSSQSTDLSDYPYPFVVNGLLDATLVVGKSAATSDVIGAVDISASLIAESRTNIALGSLDAIFDKHLASLDVDAPDLGKANMIVVGGPCVNAVAAELLDYPLPCNKDFQIGKAMIRYFPEKGALLVAGYEAQETLAASYILSDYADYDLKKLEMEVTIAEQGVLALNPIVT